MRINLMIVWQITVESVSLHPVLSDSGESVYMFPHSNMVTFLVASNYFVIILLQFEMPPYPQIHSLFTLLNVTRLV